MAVVVVFSSVLKTEIVLNATVGPGSGHIRSNSDVIG